MQESHRDQEPPAVSWSGARLWWLLTTAVLAVGVVAGFLVSAALRHPAPRDVSRAADFDHEAESAAVVERLQPALVGGSAARLAPLTAPDDTDARRVLRAVAHNVRRLRIRPLTLRYVGLSESVTGSAVRAGPHLSWQVDVQLTWRYAGVRSSRARLDVPLRLARVGDQAVFRSVGELSGRRAPLWLLGPLVVRRAPGVLVDAAPQRLARVLPMTQRARRQVRDVLPGWRGRLVVEAPRNLRGFRAAAGLSSSDGRSLAAVTTAVDGSGAVGSPVHVFLNPAVFGQLGPRAQQIVLTHEAAHVAVGATRTSVPQWLSEGFADHVALRRSGLPVQVSAAQALARTRRDGPPPRLPPDEDFGSSNPDLGATYEAAWLACRLLARDFGEPALLRFYARVDAGASVGSALVEVLGISEQRFTSRWRAHLRELAG